MSEDLGGYLAAFIVGLAVGGVIFGVVNGGAPASAFEVFVVILGAATFSALYNAWWQGRE